MQPYILVDRQKVNTSYYDREQSINIRQLFASRGDIIMSGHSKWSTIKHKKAKEDAKRGQAFTKLIKEITVAARHGGGDSDANPRLRTLLEKAKEINMPIDNSTRAIKRGTGELPGVSYEEFTYEGYGPHGIAVIVEALTDNKNRTVASLRHLFSKMGGSLGESGSVNWMFEKLGVVRVNAPKATEEQLLEILLDHDVRDLQQEGPIFSIMCEPRVLEQVKQAVEKAGLKVEEATVEWVAKTNIELDTTGEEKALDFLSALQDDEDVQHVYTNLA
jgi:YebC/PmpR family DNA-binding regulatory protein